MEHPQRLHASELPAGLYDQVITRALEGKLNTLADPRLFSTALVDVEDAHAALAQLLEHLVAGGLAQFRGSDNAERQSRVVERLMEVLCEELDQSGASDLSIATPLRRLLAIHLSTDNTANVRPDTQLSRSALLTGTRLDPSLGAQLCKEIASADRIDILCSFIRWSGLRVILEDLKRMTAGRNSTAPLVRVITTSYMGATDPRAIAELSQLPNTEVRISYDTHRTRLHAKAYIFHRQSGFGSAYIGSANLSHAALSEGLEWTTKLSHYELPYLWEKLVATFESYWQDEEFQPFTANCGQRLRDAIANERNGGLSADAAIALVDIRPYPFQEEILDVLCAERENLGKTRQLVVAATGTGKTMIAAFDYLRWRRKTGGIAPLLFIAHREEILRQSLATFRAVLREQNFGDLFVGGREQDCTDHLFCSIQSYNSRELWKLPPDKYKFVVVDEFHHAAAPSYQRLMNHVQPTILLGLTATPERADELDVFKWFGGAASAEVRLPDAINRRLLSPFQYFGVSDCVDLEGVTWQRGGYRVDELDHLYTGNHVRAQLVLQKVHEIILNPLGSRGLGFCVSIAHAEFMARFFSENGVCSVALSANSPTELRHAVQQQLRSKEVNFIFVVDLYNEGVDIPEIDTVLFLRPTESLTVFLQQLGRGLRLHDEKECLTVIDFIGSHRREFRYAARFRALSLDPTVRLELEVEHGFPHLPAGCALRLERVAQERVLTNIRDTTRLQRGRMISAIRQLGQQLGTIPSMQEVVDCLDTSIGEILKRGLWSRLLAEAGLIQDFHCPDEELLSRGLRRMCIIDDPQYIQTLLRLIAEPASVAQLDDCAKRQLAMLHVTLWGGDGTSTTLLEAHRRLQQNSVVVEDLRALLEYRSQNHAVRTVGQLNGSPCPLAIHAQYSRDEILTALGYWSMERRPAHREGVLHLPELRYDAFFVTLQKTEDEYSPTTMYEDYAISSSLFHWQSQSTTSADSPTGKRYFNHQVRGYTPLLFVREKKAVASGVTAPYAFLGPCEYQSHSGSRPISIVWKLRHPIPARLLRSMARQKVG